MKKIKREVSEPKDNNGYKPMTFVNNHYVTFNIS